MDGDRSQTIIAAFEEVPADRATDQYGNRLRVTLTSAMDEANPFPGAAKDTPSHLDGTRAKRPAVSGHADRYMDSAVKPGSSRSIQGRLLPWKRHT